MQMGNRNLKVRTGDVPSGGTQQLYDVGLFNYATVGMQSAYTVGELWVTYDVQFLKPRLRSSYGGYQHLYSTNNTASAAHPLATGGLVTENTSTSAGVYVYNSTNLAFTDVGDFVVSLQWKDSSADVTADGSFVTGPGLELRNSFWGTAAASIVEGQAARNAAAVVVVRNTIPGVVGNAPLLNITGPTGLAGANVDVMITRIPVH